MQDKSFSILIGGDLVIDQPYELSNIGADLKTLFYNSNCSIVNLEAPVTNSNSKILKTGPHLKSEEKSTLEILRDLDIQILTLANNHILDYDDKGVKDTLLFCKQNGFKTVGAGMNIEESSEILLQNTEVGCIAIVNFAENEWANATNTTAGANPMDVIDNTRQIQDARKLADYVIVIIHGGHEYYNLPSPRMQKQYRFYADQGADLVVGHHTHCINGSEIYNGVPIYYSLGNFIFPRPSIYDSWYTGLLLEIEIANGVLIPKLHPIRQKKDKLQIDVLRGKEKEEVLIVIEKYNKIIGNQVSLQKEWDTYIKTKYDTYLNYWSPLSFIKNDYLKAAFYKLKLRMLSKKGMSLHLNLMRCEAHADMSKEIIKRYLSK